MVVTLDVTTVDTFVVSTIFVESTFTFVESVADVGVFVAPPQEANTIVEAIKIIAIFFMFVFVFVLFFIIFKIVKKFSFFIK